LWEADIPIRASGCAAPGDRRDCIAFALNNLFGWAKNRPPATASWPRGSLVGGLRTHQLSRHAGGTADGLSPPLRLDKRTYVGTTVWFFFASNYAKIIPYAL
jgi:hypothetical protein